MVRNCLRLSIPIPRIIITEARKFFNTTSKGLQSDKQLVPEKNTDAEYQRVAARYVNNVSPPYSLVDRDEYKDFMSVFPDIVRNLTTLGHGMHIAETTRHFARVLKYNVPTGMKSRGFSVVEAYKMFELRKNLTSENVRLAVILGWCVEMLQGFLIIIDDILDASEIRRGAPCWYINEGVGLKAISDGFLINQGLYAILQKYLSSHKAYVPILELFHDTTLKTSLGETLDMMSVVNGKPQLDLFTMKRYRTLARYKSGYYSVHLPLALAMYLAGMFDEEIHKKVESIALEMGHFLQIKNDYMDCFGNPGITGKIGTDVKEGKCTWLVVIALQRVTPLQRKILEDHYGKPSTKSQEAVRKLYEEVDIPNIYSNFRKESFNQICTQIEQIPKILPHCLFSKLIDHLYEQKNCNVNLLS